MISFTDPNSRRRCSAMSGTPRWRRAYRRVGRRRPSLQIRASDAPSPRLDDIGRRVQRRAPARRSRAARRAASPPHVRQGGPSAGTPTPARCSRNAPAVSNWNWTCSSPPPPGVLSTSSHIARAACTDVPPRPPCPLRRPRGGPVRSDAARAQAADEEGAGMDAPSVRRDVRIRRTAGWVRRAQRDARASARPQQNQLAAVRCSA